MDGQPICANNSKTDKQWTRSMARHPRQVNGAFFTHRFYIT